MPAPVAAARTARCASNAKTQAGLRDMGCQPQSRSGGGTAFMPLNFEHSNVQTSDMEGQAPIASGRSLRGSILVIGPRMFEVQVALLWRVGRVYDPIAR